MLPYQPRPSAKNRNIQYILALFLFREMICTSPLSYMRLYLFLKKIGCFNYIFRRDIQILKGFRLDAIAVNVFLSCFIFKRYAIFHR